MVSNLKQSVINYPQTKNTNVLKFDVKHVTNIQRDIRVKLNGMVQNMTRHHAEYIERKYDIVSPSKENNHQFQNYSNARSRECQTSTTYHSGALRDNMRLSTEFIVSEDANRTSTPFQSAGGIHISNDEALAIFETIEEDSINDDQRKALEQLDDTLKDYTIDDDEHVDEGTPMIVADILPSGVFQALCIREDCQSPGTASSEEETSSGTSSLSKSINSRTGIISQKQSSTKSRNSVSFKLPDGHVDKPYAPMQTSGKPKQNNSAVSIHVQGENTSIGRTCRSPAFRITGNDVNIWHTGNKVYVESSHQRRQSGPFKGSFKSLFYRKYSTSEFNTYNEKKIYLAPKIMEKVESFESLTDEKIKHYQDNSKVAISRRHTYR